MPKVPTNNKNKKKIRSAALDGPRSRHEPLGQVIQDDAHRKIYVARTNRRTKLHRNNEVDDNMRNQEDTLDEKSSQRIMNLSKAQQLELETEESEAVRNQQHHRSPLQTTATTDKKLHQRGSVRDNNGDDDDDDDDDDSNDDEVQLEEADEEEYVIEDCEGYVNIANGALGLSPEDEALVASMMQPTQVRRTLADIILEKIEEKEAEKQQIDGGDLDTNDNNNATGQQPYALPAKVVQVYTDIGHILSRYTSGKLPKAFKVIPSLSNWEDVLYLTRPDRWTPAAMYAATRIFASNLNPKMAQRFYNLVLLDGVRADIATNKKLNYHYYMALKKSVYKPAAFFKGILLPLCQGNNCTLREAAIVASVLQRVSIPVHHSAVAIHKLAQQSSDYSGASSIFIKTLLNKKYSLPAPVIGSLVRHFASFLYYNNDSTNNTGKTSNVTSAAPSGVVVLPVLWHQALLVFVQRYKNEIQDEARESLRRVMKKHFHPKITPEIRRELFGAQAWKEERKSTEEEPVDSMEQ